VMPRMTSGPVDCLVLGGGITGAGVARDAAMRGLRTVLIESHDFASGTSHLTSKLIHGGLRYLEQCRFRLVAEGIIERDRLLNRLAPNLVSPLRFVIPFEGARFPKWLLTVCGLQLYGLAEWLRSGRRSRPIFAAGLRNRCPTMLRHPLGVDFWDAQTNDARLVLATVRTASAAGADVHNYTNVLEAKRVLDGWRVRVRSDLDDREWTIEAGVVVNATGPWSPMTAEQLGIDPQTLLWVKGSHVLLRRPPEFGSDAVIIRSVRDRRALWIIPWETRLIVGSTESLYRGDLRNVRPSAEEVDDLFDSFVHYFGGLRFTRNDILGAYSGVRPIVSQNGDSENTLSRHHEVLVDRKLRFVTITGGKLTTFRSMAEQAVDHVERLLERPRASSATRDRLRRQLLWPGVGRAELATLTAKLTARYGASISSTEIVAYLSRCYGSDADEILGDIVSQPSLGEPLFDELPYCLAEMRYLCTRERVGRLLDLVKRRTSVYFLARNGSLDQLPRILECIAPLLGWSPDRQAAELASVAAEFREDTKAFSAIDDVESAAPDLALCV